MMNREEVWKPVVCYEGYYEVSSLGQVRSVKTGRILKQGCNDGYLQVKLYIDGEKQTIRCHILVAKAFIPNPNDCSMVNHKDESRDNNVVDNLEWCTHLYNVNYGSGIERNAIAHKKPILQLNCNGEILHRYDSTIDMHRITGFNTSNVCACCKEVTKSAYGYRWKYEK